MMITKNGRRRLGNSIIYRLRFLIFPIASLYLKTIIRHVKIIAVVGSFGKTTTTRAIAAALGNSPEKYQGTNNGVFLVVELLKIPPWAHAGVLEVGISKKGQMAKNAKLIRPDIVAVTCIGSEQGTSLGGLDNTREEKAQIVRSLPIRVRGLKFCAVNGYGFFAKKIPLFTEPVKISKDLF
ncbi:MAG: Mur ligase family protein [Clostridia bacterium]|nr:Mur ligase family protein [Clostridia bacterium]